MTVLRATINPHWVTFPTDIVHDGDYESMIGLGALLIALDAMLLVVLNFRRLKHWLDALILAAYVGLTHVLFPLATFAITALVYWPFRSGMVSDSYAILSMGVVSAVYYIAFHFITHHLREVNEGLYSSKVDHAPEGLRSWKAIKGAWGSVFAVSIDALIVGPGKVAIMDRFPLDEFLMSFVWIGLGVFILVLGAGLMVIMAHRFAKTRMKQLVRIYDFWSFPFLVIVFQFFAILAALYLLFTFFPAETLLRSETLWSISVVAAVAFLWKVDRPRLREAVEKRSEAVQPEVAIT